MEAAGDHTGHSRALGCRGDSRSRLRDQLGPRRRSPQRPVGATEEEATRPLPGDDGVPHPDIASTRAISIHAPVHAVWPWLVQMGWKRAGWYSYDMLDNERTPSAETIVPDLQTLQVGDFVPEGPEVGWTVRSLEPDRLLLLETHAPMKGVTWVQQRDSSWLFLLIAIDAENTRLIERARTTVTINRHTPLGRLLAPPVFMPLLLAPGDFVMARRQMLGIKRRAERASGGCSARVRRSTLPDQSPTSQSCRH